MPTGAERFVFMIAPAMIIVPALLVFAVIPFGEPFTIAGRTITPYLADVNIALLFVLAVSSIGIYGIILGGWSSNNKFSLMGGLRSAAQMMSYEVPMGFAMVAVVLMAGSLSLVEIVEAQRVRRDLVHVPGDSRFRHLLRLRGRRDQPQPLRPARGGVGAGGRLPHRVLRDEVRALLPRRVRQHAGGRVARRR